MGYKLTDVIAENDDFNEKGVGVTFTNEKNEVARNAVCLSWDVTPWKVAEQLSDLADWIYYTFNSKGERYDED